MRILVSTRVTRRSWLIIENRLTSLDHKRSNSLTKMVFVRASDSYDVDDTLFSISRENKFPLNSSLLSTVAWLGCRDVPVSGQKKADYV